VEILPPHPLSLLESLIIYYFYGISTLQQWTLIGGPGFMEEWDVLSHTGPMLGLMLCSHHLEILNKFLNWTCK
jgi:hypothetical protein